MTNWRLIVLSTAEEPLLSDDSHDGMNTRVMEIHGVPVEDKGFASELHNISVKRITDSPGENSLKGCAMK